MFNHILGAAAAAILATGGPVQAETEWPACGEAAVWPGEHWPAPDTTGWDAAALAEAQALFAASQADSVMIVHRGRPVAAWGPVGDPLTIQSMRKPVLGALIGLLVADGALSLDDTLAALGVQDSDPPLTPDDRAATLRDLLLARSGVFHDANYEVGGWRRLRVRLREAGEAARGRWFYNNWDFNALGVIAQQAGGAPLGEQIASRIAAPIGMEDFDPALTSWSGRNSLAQQHFGYGSDIPAWMFEISTRDLARFGLLYLACGEWAGETVLPRDWVLASIEGVDTYADGQTMEVTGFDRYGYLWWIEAGGDRPRFGGLEHAQPFYGGSGNRGHYLLVFPRFDLVIVHQPRTVGGIGDDAQLSRARNGSPAVEARDFQALVNAILAAHPEM